MRCTQIQKYRLPSKVKSINLTRVKICKVATHLLMNLKPFKNLTTILKYQGQYKEDTSILCDFEFIAYQTEPYSTKNIRSPKQMR